MRRLDLTFVALLVPLDAITLLIAAMMGYTLRHSPLFNDVLRPLLQAIPFQDYLSYSIAFIFCWIGIFALTGLYSIRPRRYWNEFGRIVVACSAGIMIVIATIFFGRELTTSRFLVLAMWLLSILFIAIERFIVRQLKYSLLRRRLGHQRVVLIGQNKTADDLAKTYAQNPVHGYTIVKRLKGWSDFSRRELSKLKKEDKIDSILLADPHASKEEIGDLFACADELHLTIRYVADPVSTRTNLFDVSTDLGVPIIEIKRTPLDGWGRIAKRLFDLVASGILIVLLSPIMLITAIAILIESRGGVLFSKLPDGSPALRIGEKGKPFHYFKFRSMYKDLHFQRYNELADQDIRKGPLVKIKNDPRVTKVGRFIRKWSIDELPELFLVFLGRMSLVGPRPHLPEEVEKYESHHLPVLTIKPGITGMAQISGRSNLDFDDEVRLDTWYIEHWSLWLDVYILLKTPFVVLGRKGLQEKV